MSQFLFDFTEILPCTLSSCCFLPSEKRNNKKANQTTIKFDYVWLKLWLGCLSLSLLDYLMKNLSTFI